MLQGMTYACQWVIHIQALLPHLCLGWMPRISPFNTKMVQIEAMRAVCKRGRRHPIRDLLKETNWLSVRQLVLYHSVIQVWKVINNRHPVYLHSRLVGNRPRYADRLAAAGSLIRGRRPRLDLIESSWGWRVAQYWEEHPRSIREIDNGYQYKTNLKLRILNSKVVA